MEVLIGMSFLASSEYSIAVSRRRSYLLTALLVLAFSAFLDFYLAIYPAYMLLKLQMPLRKKLALSSALGFGLV